MHALVASAALALSRPAQVPAAAPPIRAFRPGPHGPRYLRTRSRITFAGVTGDCISVFDFRTGRIAERVSAGVLSYSDGFDGRREWSADVTGMPVIEGNRETLADRAVWNVIYGGPERERPRVRTLRTSASSVVMRLRYPSLTVPLDVTVDRRTGYPRLLDDPTGDERSLTVFADYRPEAGVVFPHVTAGQSRFGSLTEVFVSAEAPESIPDSEFEPPTPPHDTALDGVTRVPMRFRSGELVVPVRLNDGPVLHMLLDSGSSNFISRRAARRLGLRLTGRDRAGGIGPGTVRESYTSVRRIRIGAAEMRDQPFQVLDYEHGADVDGALGCETFERFAIRLDFAHRSVLLARDVSDLGMLGTPVPMRLSACTPEIDGAIDGVSGPLMIDTGSAWTVDVLTPAVNANHLLTRYRHIADGDSGGGIGGETEGAFVIAHGMRLGPVRISGLHLWGHFVPVVPITLQKTPRGAFASTADLANVGTLILQMFSPTFDFRGGTLWLQPTSL